jgi:hypothetical protein
MAITVEGGIDIGPGIGIGGTPPPPPAPQQAYTTPGTFSWTAPAGVTSVCVVCVGGGAGGKGTFPSTGGGGGGGLGWKNNITVTPGQSYTVVVGAGGNSANTTGGNSYFINLTTVAGYGGVSADRGAINGTRANFVGDGGGQGGAGAGNGDNFVSFGGGGAGGYSGNGGNGGGGQNNNGSGTTGYAGYPPQTGSGGGGGGGDERPGGSVGILGQGSDGTSPSRIFVSGNWVYFAGTPGSNGATSGNLYDGGLYGAGGAGVNDSLGGGGAVRIIWGAGRAFPSTNTGDL